MSGPNLILPLGWAMTEQRQLRDRDKWRHLQIAFIPHTYDVATEYPTNGHDRGCVCLYESVFMEMVREVSSSTQDRIIIVL